MLLRISGLPAGRAPRVLLAAIVAGLVALVVTPVAGGDPQNPELTSGPRVEGTAEVGLSE